MSIDLSKLPKVAEKKPATITLKVTEQMKDEWNKLESKGYDGPECLRQLMQFLIDDVNKSTDGSSTQG